MSKEERGPECPDCGLQWDSIEEFAASPSPTFSEYGGHLSTCRTRGTRLAEDPDVSHPSHYTSHPSGIECLTITRHMNFNLGNAFKYIWRAGLKGKPGATDLEVMVTDLEKAIFYLQDEVRRVQGEEA